jgi:hypothetical protein
VSASAAELQAGYDKALRRQRELYGAAPTTVEALMFSLRERGTAVLSESDGRRRLSELTAEQMLEVAARLQKIKPGIAPPWTAEQVDALYETKARL